MTNKIYYDKLSSHYFFKQIHMSLFSQKIISGAIAAGMVVSTASTFASTNIGTGSVA